MAALMMSPSSLSLRSLSSLLPNPLPILSFPSRAAPSLTIVAGGGPRTFPGGVSKWQWKRMQAKKAKQLLKARLLRERQIYEMRKRAELKAAAAKLEKPWELVEAAPALFSVAADDQVRALADRFVRPGGFDMWSDRDGPRVFSGDPLPPSERLFPKGAVHSLKPYTGSPADGDDDDRGRRRLRRVRKVKELDCAEGVRQNDNEEGFGRRSYALHPTSDLVVDVECRDSVLSNTNRQNAVTLRPTTNLVRRTASGHARREGARSNAPADKLNKNVDVRRYGLISPPVDTGRNDSTRLRPGYKWHVERGRERVENSRSKWQPSSNLDNKGGANHSQMSDPKRNPRTTMNDNRRK